MAAPAPSVNPRPMGRTRMGDQMPARKARKAISDGLSAMWDANMGLPISARGAIGVPRSIGNWWAAFLNFLNGIL